MPLLLKSALALTTLAALGLASARPAAAGLVGTPVTGSIMFGSNPTNYFDPANGFVPAGFGNTAGTTVTVTDSQVEFGFNDGLNKDTADFTDGQLILTDVSQGNGANVTYTFTDPAFSSVSKLFDDFSGGGLTYSLVGHTLTINEAAFFTAGTQIAIFNITASAVPEASTTASLGLLLALGMGGVLVAARRKNAGAAFPA